MILVDMNLPETSKALGKEDVFVALTRATSRLDIITSSEEAFAYYDTQVPISGAET